MTFKTCLDVSHPAPACLARSRLRSPHLGCVNQHCYILMASAQPPTYSPAPTQSPVSIWSQFKQREVRPCHSWSIKTSQRLPLQLEQNPQASRVAAQPYRPGPADLTSHLPPTPAVLFRCHHLNGMFYLYPRHTLNSANTC